MDTSKVGYMFSVDQNPRKYIHKIIWFNDSSCIVVFYNPQNTIYALQSLLLDPNAYKTKAEEEGGIVLPKDWFELKPYDVLGFKRQLFVRYATMSELMHKAESKENRWTLFNSARGSLQLFLLDKFNGHLDYKDITRQLKFKKYSQAMFEQPKFRHRATAITDSKRFYDYIEARPAKPLKSGVRPVSNENASVNGNGILAEEDSSLDRKMVVENNENPNNKSIVIEMVDEDDEEVKILPVKPAEEIKKKITPEIQQKPVIEVPKSLPNPDVVNLLAEKERKASQSVEKKPEVSSKAEKAVVMEVEAPKKPAQEPIPEPVRSVSVPQASQKPQPSSVPAIKPKPAPYKSTIVSRPVDDDSYEY